MEFRRHVLPNGLEIVAECNAAAYTTAVGFFVNTGARDEDDRVAGVSHFLEHMAFKGTPTRSPDDVNREFDAMGAYYNAQTDEENTIYYAAVLPEFQQRALQLLGDILRPALRQADFDTEKHVILEEIHMYEDQPPFGADDKCRALHFGSHPLGRSVLGSVQSITQLSLEAMRNYFRRRYSPGNIVLAAAGKIDFDRLIGCAAGCCGPWEPVEAGRLAERPQTQQGFHVLQKPSATQQYVLQLADGPTAEDPDRYAARLLAVVLGDETGSRLYWELVDPGLAEQASLHRREYQRAGLMITWLSCAPERAAENVQRVRDVYRRAEGEGITPEELQQAKNKVRSRIVLSGERPFRRLFAVGSDWLDRREYRTVRDEIDAVAAVTLDELHAVLAKYPLTAGTIMTIGPLSEISAPG